MIVFHKFCRIAPSSGLHKTKIGNELDSNYVSNGQQLNQTMPGTETQKNVTTRTETNTESDVFFVCSGIFPGKLQRGALCQSAFVYTVRPVTGSDSAIGNVKRTSPNEILEPKNTLHSHRHVRRSIG